MEGGWLSGFWLVGVIVALRRNLISYLQMTLLFCGDRDRSATNYSACFALFRSFFFEGDLSESELTAVGEVEGVADWVEILWCNVGSSSVTYLCL